jgi:hypothetical protein
MRITPRAPGRAAGRTQRREAEATAMTKKWASVLAVVLGTAAAASAQAPTTLPMPAQVAGPQQAPPPAAAPAAPALPPGAAPAGPGCASGFCGHEQVGCLKRFCNWITYHPLTRGCECVCGCGCCSDCCGYHGFQPLYTYFVLPCAEAPYRYGTSAGCACGGHGKLFQWGLCKGCHGGPITPPGIE